MSFVTTAPGKVILFGEHAVCFGKEAVATAVDKRTKVEININKGSNCVSLNLINLVYNVKWTLDQLSKINLDSLTTGQDDGKEGEYNENIGKLLDDVMTSGDYQLNGTYDDNSLRGENKEDKRESAIESTKSFLFAYLSMAKNYSNGKLLEMDVTVSSNIPIGGGLGSSAAFSVSLSGALLRVFLGTNPDNELVNRWAYQSEKLFHGKPSGIDNNIATAGGTLMFKDNHIIHSDKMRLESLVLVETGVKRNTKTLVRGTISRRQMFPGVINNVIDAIGDIGSLVWKNLNGDLKCDFKTLVEMNQHLLNCLGAGHTVIDEILLLAKKHGFAGKLTGAGGGGCVIIFIEDAPPESVKNLLDNLNERGFKAEQINVNCKGISFQ